MSEVEIYTIAKVAREKLLSEYHVRDHDLQKLVAHANLYDHLLDAYYEQEGAVTERTEEEQQSSPTRRVTFNVPVERLPIRGKDETNSESKDERCKTSLAPKEDVEFCEAKLVSDYDHSEPSEESAHVTIVEMNLEDDG
jgi:hypothetical protein